MDRARERCEIVHNFGHKKSDGKRPLGRPRPRWEMDLKT
jgi:hypothetical protein